MPALPYLRQLEHTAILTCDSDGDDARFGSDRNDIQLVCRQKLRPTAQDLFNRKIGTALEFQECGIGRQRTTEELRLKLKLLKSAFAEVLDLS